MCPMNCVHGNGEDPRSRTLGAAVIGEEPSGIQYMPISRLIPRLA